MMNQQQPLGLFLVACVALPTSVSCMGAFASIHYDEIQRTLHDGAPPGASKGYVGFTFWQRVTPKELTWTKTERHCESSVNQKLRAGRGLLPDPLVGMHIQDGEEWKMIAPVGDVVSLPVGKHRLKFCLLDEQANAMPNTRLFSGCGTPSPGIEVPYGDLETEVEVSENQLLAFRPRAEIIADCGTFDTTMSVTWHLDRVSEIPWTGAREDLPKLDAFVEDTSFTERIWVFEAFCRTGRNDRKGVLDRMKRYAGEPYNAYTNLLANKVRDSVESGSASCLLTPAVADSTKQGGGHRR